jgi:queuine/archaeosine tRNA-ribosyltransferase
MEYIRAIVVALLQCEIEQNTIICSIINMHFIHRDMQKVIL